MTLNEAGWVRSARVKVGFLVGAVALSLGAVGAAARPAGSAPAVAHLYWTNRQGGKIVKANLDGTDPAKIVTGQIYPTGLAVNQTNMYWTDQGGANTVVEANLDGTNPRTIATGGTSYVRYAVAVSGGNIYWANYGTGTRDKIVEANLDGTHPKTIAVTPYPRALAVTGRHLYWAAGSKVVEANLDGTNARTIVKGVSAIGGVAVTGGHLYWATSGEIVEAGLNGSGPKTIQTERYGTINGLAAGGGSLYWTFGGTVVESNLDGTNPRTIAQGGIPYGVAVGP